MSEQSLRFQKSVRLQERGRELIPGGSHTYAKGDDQYPLLAPGRRAKGETQIGCRRETKKPGRTAGLLASRARERYFLPFHFTSVAVPSFSTMS